MKEIPLTVLNKVKNDLMCSNSWTVEKLTGTNLVFLLTSEDKKIIIKHTLHANRNIDVQRIYSEYSIPIMDVNILDTNWISISYIKGFPLGKIDDRKSINKDLYNHAIHPLSKLCGFLA